MFLSDRTLKLLIEMECSVEQKVRLLRSLDEDWNAATGKDHDQAIVFAANCLEGGVDADWILAAITANRATWDEVVVRYRRRVPADWAEIRTRIFERDGEVCRYCGTTSAPFHIDHITPLRWGGTNDDGNLCVACQPCNLSKSDSTVEQWRARK